MPLSLSRLLLGAALVFAAAAPVAAGDAFDQLQATWNGLHDYRVTIDAHEVLGDQTDDHVLRYAFRKPSNARLDVVEGSKSGSTIVWDGGDRVTAYRRGMSFFKMHGGVWQKDLTSLRGNGVLTPNMGDLVACFAQHRDDLREGPGPLVDGDPTAEIALNRTNVTCADDPPADHDVTLDVIDVSRKTGLIMMRRRYEGDQVVERWELKDYQIDAGLGDSDLR
jgi:outer membrane lipoprotein-sorting protein